MRTLALILVLGCGGLLNAAPPKPSRTPASLTCKKADDTRVVRSEHRADGSCEVIYSKNGSNQSVASGQQSEDCEISVNKIRATLEGAGFKCR